MNQTIPPLHHQEVRLYLLIHLFQAHLLFLDGSSKSFFIRTIIPFLLLQFSVGLCSSLQATFYPIEASSKGATASQFGAVFGIIHLSLFMFGKLSLEHKVIKK